VLDEDAHDKKNAFILNHAYHHFLACTDADIHGLSLGQFIEQFMHPEDILRERPFIDEVNIGSRSHYAIEKRYLRSDGTIRWGILNNLIVRDSEGRFVRSVGIVQDITERKNTEQTLRSQQEQLLAIYQALPDTIIRIDRQGHYLALKPPAGLVLYDDPEQTIGQHISENVPAEVAKLALHYLNRLFDTGAPQHFEHTLVIGGQLRYRENRLVTLNDHEALIITRDITDRKRAELNLQLQTERLLALYQGIPDALTVISKEGMLLESKPPRNYEPYHFTALKVGDSLEKNAPEHVARLIRDKLADLFDSGEMQEYVYSLYTESEIHYREGRLIKLNNDEALSLVRDITEQKRAEAALLAEKEHLLRLYQAIPEQIIRFGKHGTILDYKPASDFPASSTPEHAIGKHVLEVAETPELGAEIMHYLKQTFDTGTVQAFEQHFSHHGNEHYREHRMVKVNDDEAITLIRNTTETRRAERALSESKQRLDLAIDAAHLGIWDLSIDNELTQVNSHFRQILGLAPDEPVTFTAMLEDAHPEDRATVQADIAELHAGSKQRYGHDRRQRHRNGNYRWLHVTGAVVEHDAFGQPQRFVSIIQDIHEQKTTQLHLEETLFELEQALRDKDVLLAEVHHRVKNNMQVIGSIMSLHARETDEPTAKAVLLASRARIRTMAAIHEVMYNTEIFSDLELGTYLQTIARSLVQLHYRNFLQQERPQPHLHFDLMPVSVSLQDALPCALIFNELLSNALKHAFPEHYQADRPTITIRLQENADDVILSVIDSGVGSSNASKNFGSFIVDSLVEQLQGSLELSSTTSDTATKTASTTDTALIHNVPSNTGTTATLRFSRVLLL
jgi:PAS domain S-box-containing protein